MRVVVLVLVLLAGIARADDKPWAAGVSAADQKQALALYNQGNEQFASDAFLEALATYEQALAVWDHPSIHYNAAVCLIHLDRLVEAYAHLTQAMKYGAAPLGPALWKEAQSYDKLLARQLGELEVSCDEPGAELTLDGKPLFTAPGTATRRVLTGDHQIVATKSPTHLTETRMVTVTSGDTTRVAITLRTREPARRLVRRWDAWKPWAVVVTGGVVAATGAGLYAWTAGDYDALDADIRDAQMAGMQLLDAEDRRDALDRRSILTYGTLVAGAATLATGFVLVVANQPRLAPAVTPQLGREQVGLAISGRW